jgi:hypothetical protein
LLFVVAAAAMLAGTPIRDVRAQHTGPGRISETLQQARQLYEELLPVARRLGDRGILDRMQTLRQQWMQANGHFQGRRYQMAGTLADRNLRAMRQLAVTMQRLAQRLPYYARMAEQNRELHQMLMRRLGADAPEQIARQLTLAADAIERAQHARQRGNLVQAYRFMEQAQVMLHQVLRHVEREALTPEAVRLEVEETEGRIERLQTSEQLTDTARQALERAIEIQQEARQLLGAGRLRLAMARTLTARTALRLAQRLMAGALGPDDAAAAIGHAEELLEIHADLAGHEDAQVRTLMEQAARQVTEARGHMEQGRLRAAVESAQSAAKLVLTAVRIARGTPPPLPTSPSSDPGVVSG